MYDHNASLAEVASLAKFQIKSNSKPSQPNRQPGNRHMIIQSKGRTTRDRNSPLKVFV